MGKKKIQNLINSLAKLKTDFYQKDFLLTWEHTDAEIKAVVLAAEILEEMYRANISTRVFDAGLAVSNFRDKSTRTRFSYASAASLLGLTAQDLDEAKSQVSHGETMRIPAARSPAISLAVSSCTREWTTGTPRSRSNSSPAVQAWKSE